MIIFDEDQILSEIFASNTLRDKGVNLNIAITENGANIQKQKTFVDEAVDVVKATPGAVGDFGVGVAKGVPVGASKFGTEIMDTITNGAYSKSFIPFVNQKLPIIGDINNYINNLLKPEGTAQKAGSAIGEGVGQVVVPGAVGTKALQGVNIGSTFLRNVLGYGSAEVIGMNAQDQGLLELGTSFFVSNDNLKQEIINSLKADEDQSVLMQKIQKAPQRFFEGGIVGEALGKAIEGVGVLYRAMKGSDKIKNALQNIGEKAQGELDLEKNTTDLPEKVDLSKRKTVKTLGSLPAVAVANNPVVGALSKIGDTSVAKTVTPNTFSNFIKNLYAGIVPDKNTAEMIQDNISNIQNNMADDGLKDSPDYEDLQVAYDDLAQIVKDNKFPAKIELHTSANDLYKNNVIENIESNYKGDEEFLENMYDIKLDPEPDVKAVGEADKLIKQGLAKLKKPTNQEDGIIAFHGSGADFDEFKLTKIGTGEGNQAFGYGLYFSDSKDIAKFYKNQILKTQNVEFKGKPIKFMSDKQDISDKDAVLSKVRDRIIGGKFDAKEAIQNVKYEYEQTIENSFDLTKDLKGIDKITYERLKSSLDFINNLDVNDFDYQPGKLYKVNLQTKIQDLLDYDLPLKDQPDNIKKAIKKLNLDFINENSTGEDIYDLIAVKKFSLGDNKLDRDMLKFDDKRVSELLNSVGIKGLKFKSGQLSGIEDSKDTNFVIFDDKIINILAKYGIVGPVAVSSLGLSKQGDDDGST
jgi:hypothetical protein